MKKSSRYIAICITALFLSICIPIVSIGMENVDTYIGHSGFSFGGGGNTPSSYQYYSPTDSTSDFPPVFTNYYINFDEFNDGYIMTNYTVTNPTVQVVSTYDYVEEFNSFDTIIIADDDKLGNWFQRISFQVLVNGIWRYDNLEVSGSFLNRTSPQEITSSWGYSAYVSWSKMTVAGPTGDTGVYKISFYGDNYCRIYQITNSYRVVGSGYFLIPIYKIKYTTTTYTMWEQEQKQMHEQTLNEISQIGDDVSRVGNEVSKVGVEVSKIGGEISQFHNDLTSYDESDAPNVNDFNMSDNIDTINSFDTEISNFIDENNGYTSYDYDTEYSGIGDNFSWDEQTDGDMSFWDFVVNLWGTLQMRVIIVAFVPLAFAYVILKFVIGGIM